MLMRQANQRWDIIQGEVALPAEEVQRCHQSAAEGLHEKGVEVVGGVQSLLHCRSQTVHSRPSHPAAATISMSMPPPVAVHVPLTQQPFVIYHFSFLSSHFSLASSRRCRLTLEGQRSAGWWVRVEGAGRWGVEAAGDGVGVGGAH